MATTLEKAALELLGLPAASRAWLAEKLIASLEDVEATPDIELDWKKTALRRYSNIKKGKTTCRDAKLAISEARKKIRK